MPIKFQVPSTVSKIVTMGDHCLRLQIDTQELSNEEMTKVLRLYNLLGWFIFSEVVLTDEDLVNLPDIKPEFEEKSPSKRLRDRLFVYYRDTHANIEDFETWYKKEMDRIGNHYLQKINS